MATKPAKLELKDLLKLELKDLLTRKPPKSELKACAAASLEGALTRCIDLGMKTPAILATIQNTLQEYESRCRSEGKKPAVTWVEFAEVREPGYGGNGK